MFRFTVLEILHRDMSQKKETRALFPFSYNNKNFSCIFLTDIQPFRLYLSTLGENPEVFEIQLNNNYAASTYMEDYKKLIDYLGLKYNPNHIFRPSDFFAALNSKTPTKFRKAPDYKQVVQFVSLRRTVDEASKVYFFGWKNNSKGRYVTTANLEKTRSAFGDVFAKMCKEKNISSCWTDIPRDENLKKLNELIKM